MEAVSDETAADEYIPAEDAPSDAAAPVEAVSDEAAAEEEEDKP